MTFLCKLAILWILSELNTAATFDRSSSNISGEFASLGQMPWHVLLKRNKTDQVLCGGSIISNKWILTAARCLEGLKSIFMVFGTINLNDTSNTSLTSTKFFIYPTFNATALIDDIALIELSTPLNFSKNIQAIELATPADANNTFVGFPAYVSGFGYYNNNTLQYSPQLLWDTEDIINNFVCYDSYKFMSNNLLCSNDPFLYTESPCVGDNGGALVYRYKSNKYKQIGISSFTKQPCSKNPTLYTRITSYLDYINNITGLNVK